MSKKIEKMKKELLENKEFMKMVEETKTDFENEQDIEQIKYWYYTNIKGVEYE